jgi:hypothetical protein
MKYDYRLTYTGEHKVEWLCETERFLQQVGKSFANS